MPINTAHLWSVRIVGGQRALHRAVPPARSRLRSPAEQKPSEFAPLALAPRRDGTGAGGRTPTRDGMGARGGRGPRSCCTSARARSYRSPAIMETIAHRHRAGPPRPGSRPPTRGDRTPHPPSRRAAATPTSLPRPPGPAGLRPRAPASIPLASAPPRESPPPRLGGQVHLTSGWLSSF